MSRTYYIAKIALLLGLVLAAAGGLSAQDLSLYQKKHFISGADTLPYRLLLPEGYDASRQYPLLLFLHGAGERGNDNEKQLRNGGALFVRDDVRRDYPCIVLAPQCATGDYWSNVVITTDSVTRKRIFNFQEKGEPTRAMATLMKLLHEAVSKYAVDKTRIYAGGLSMGGMGTFEIVRRNPNVFAAAFPFCGGAHTATAKDLKNTAWWIFHGAKDDVVTPLYSQSMFASLQAENASVGFTLYPHANHNCWDAAFADPELLKWLFKQQKTITDL
ncbi:MAG: dienelactone hydrolase family protein [Prevotellaceae bacterium]|jgi:predicted peptidase|nr:dienelactone hydrolase family protein [Prevotellaceae bacterium]